MYLAGTARHFAEAVAGVDTEALLVPKNLVCVALEGTEANPRRNGRKGRKLAEAAKLARRSASPEPWGSAALGGQPSAMLEATAQALDTGSPATGRPDSEDMAFLADSDDERRPGFTQSE